MKRFLGWILALAFTGLALQSCEYADYLAEIKQSWKQVSDEIKHQDWMTVSPEEWQERIKDGILEPSEFAPAERTRSAGGVLYLRDGGKISFSSLVGVSPIIGETPDGIIRVPVEKIKSLDLGDRESGCSWFHGPKGDFFEYCDLTVETDDGDLSLKRGIILRVENQEKINLLHYYPEEGDPNSTYKTVNLREVRKIAFER